VGEKEAGNGWLMDELTFMGFILSFCCWIVKRSTGE
jgi:hypothetical protein